MTIPKIVQNFSYINFLNFFVTKISICSHSFFFVISAFLPHNFIFLKRGPHIVFSLIVFMNCLMM